MPSIKSYLTLVFVTLGFAIIVASIAYFSISDDIRNNWPKYRCNPAYAMFSTDLSADFQTCVMDTQSNMMQYLLQPLHYTTNTLTSMTGELGESLNAARQSISNLRNFVTNIIESIFGVFLNLVVEFQKMGISIQDTIGKIIGIVMTVMYVLDGSIKTMNSAWSGPPGQMVQALGSCFHPNTLVQLKNGDLVEMDKLTVGTILKDGSIIEATMRLLPHDSFFYRVSGGERNNFILVTGSHLVWSNKKTQFIPVSAEETAIKNQTEENMTPYVVCLITNTHRILIGERVFCDWEDDLEKQIYTTTTSEKKQPLSLSFN